MRGLQNSAVESERHHLRTFAAAFVQWGFPVTVEVSVKSAESGSVAVAPKKRWQAEHKLFECWTDKLQGSAETYAWMERQCSPERRHELIKAVCDLEPGTVLYANAPATVVHQVWNGVTQKYEPFVFGWDRSTPLRADMIGTYTYRDEQNGWNVTVHYVGNPATPLICEAVKQLEEGACPYIMIDETLPLTHEELSRRNFLVLAQSHVGTSWRQHKQEIYKAWNRVVCTEENGIFRPAVLHVARGSRAGTLQIELLTQVPETATVCDFSFAGASMAICPDADLPADFLAQLSLWIIRREDERALHVVNLGRVCTPDDTSLLGRGNHEYTAGFRHSDYLRTMGRLLAAELAVLQTNTNPHEIRVATCLICTEPDFFSPQQLFYHWVTKHCGENEEAFLSALPPHLDSRQYHALPALDDEED